MSYAGHRTILDADSHVMELGDFLDDFIDPGQRDRLKRAGMEALEPVFEKAVSMSPLDRYGSCGELIAAARAAAGGTHVRPRRLAISVALLLLAAIAGATLAFAGSALFRDSTSPQVTTVVAKPPPSPVALDTLVLQSKDGRTLNDAAYFLIKGSEYARAIPFARKAMTHAAKGSVTRGYATFNLGFALLEVGRCSEALPLLQRALKLEAADQRRYITPRVEQARSCLRGGASGPVPSQSSGALSGPSQGP